MTDSATDAWIRRFSLAHRARHQLVCFPHAGGSASYFFPVARALAPSIEVLAVQYPGRQDRRAEPCVDNVAELAELVATALRPTLDRPVTFFGHSLGATVAFEVARLIGEKIDLTALFASGRRAPSRHRDERNHLLGDTELLAEVHTLNGTASALLDDDEIRRMVLPSLRSDYKAAETYRYTPGPDLTCPIFALVGDADPKVNLDEAKSWAVHTSGAFTLRVFPGGHFYLADHQAEVLRTITGHVNSVTQVRT